MSKRSILAASTMPAVYRTFSLIGIAAKFSHCWEPFSILCEHKPTLEATEICTTKHDEDHVAPPVDLPRRFLLNDDLCHEICGTGLHDGNANLELEGVSLGKI